MWNKLQAQETFVIIDLTLHNITHITMKWINYTFKLQEVNGKSLFIILFLKLF